jgi:TolA-binding protein
MKSKLLFFLLPLLLFVFTGCSSKTDQELWDSAVNNHKQAKLNEAIKLYSEVADEYPESRLAPDALFEVAKIYNSALDKNVSRLESLKKAVEYYNMVYTKYPKSKKAPASLFMMAFIQANELHKTDDAKKNYEKFITEYPSNEMVSSAQEEIKIIGMDPEQVLMKNKIVKK